MMVVFTTELVPFKLQIAGWHWALIIPLALVVGCFGLDVEFLLLDCVESLVVDLFVLRKGDVDFFLFFYYRR